MRHAALLLFLTGCSLTPAEGPGELSGAPYRTPALEGSSGDADDESGDESTGDPVALDLPPSDGLEIDPCKAVDILFVIDNSDSMDDNQTAIAASAPLFIEQIEALGTGHEGGIHIGVTSTDVYTTNPLGCRAMGSLVTRGETCPEPLPHEPAAPFDDLAPNPTCGCGPYVEGGSYMTLDDDLSRSLTCAMDLGPGGGHETPTDAAILAISGFENSPGQCNEGFHRVGSTTGDFTEERAALILVYITDEDDKSGGTPEQWVERLQWHRQGDLSDVIFIGIAGGDCASELPWSIRSFAGLLPWSHMSTICATDFGPVFAEALPTIADGCATDYVPEG